LEALRRYREAEAQAWAASRAEVLACLSAAIRADPLPIVRGDPPEAWPPELRRAVQSLRLDRDGRVTAVTLADRAAAARILGQAQGWLQPEIHVSAIVGIADRLSQARARVSGSGEAIDALPAPPEGSQTRTDQAPEDAPADPPRS
jgi:hypothetical protein